LLKSHEVVVDKTWHTGSEMARLLTGCKIYFCRVLSCVSNVDFQTFNYTVLFLTGCASKDTYVEHSTVTLLTV